MTDERRRTGLSLDDVRLQPQIETDETRDRDKVLEDFVREAGPRIRRILSAYRSTGFSPQDREDLVSAVHLRLIAQLRRTARPTDQVIRNLNDYVATLTYNTVHEAMRRRFPERRRLMKRIRYAMQRDDRLTMIVEMGTVICAIREQGPPFVPGSLSPTIQERLRGFREPAALADAIFALLSQSGHPLLLEHVVQAIGDLWNISETQLTVADETMPDPRRSALAIVQSREYLSALLAEIRELPGLQRSALLLNLRDGEGGCATVFFILAGMTTFEELAGLVALSTEELASIWNDLPLDDRSIAFRLGRTRQQVINLRRSARERLLRRLQKRGVGRQ